MPQADDIFSSTTTAALRNIATACCPRRGASRMAREQIINLLLTSMLAEENDLLQRAARRPVHEVDNAPHLLPKVHRRMGERYGHLMPPYLQSSLRRSDPVLGTFQPAATTSHSDVAQQEPLWPQLVPAAVKDACSQRFLDGTNIGIGPTCAVCARRTFTQDILFKPNLTCVRKDIVALDLAVLQVSDPHLLTLPPHYFQYGDPRLDGMALERQGIHVSPECTEVDICDECDSALSKQPPQLPALALANGTMRGWLPEHLQDVTWLEERLCAKYLGVAYVVRLYDFEARLPSEQRARTMKGHTCSFPLNTISTATALPWKFSSGGPLVSCIIIGPRKPRKEDFNGVFTVRRQKVHDLLVFLREHFQDYPQFPLDQDALQELPENGVPEHLMQHVIHEERQGEEVLALFERETAGLDKHPGLFEDGATDQNIADLNHSIFLEHHGLVDINGVAVSGRSRTAAALANATGAERPDLIIRHGSVFIQDYNNPHLFPGMFPTLYPWGTGGFEAKSSTKLSFKRHAAYLLDLADHAFRRHWSYIFAVANIMQRRAIHLGTRLACKARDHERFSALLRELDQPLVKQITTHLSSGGSLRGLTPAESKIFDLLKKCELASANVPGSKAIMTRARADIRAFVGQFGIFQLFLTLNPGPAHSPVFHILFGDESFTLSTDRPSLPDSKTRAIRVADDPVAASDYFHFHIAAVFQYLLGWDLRSKESTPGGGIFGELSAFFLVKEHTMRGQLHAHCLIWLHGGLNPAQLRAKMRTDEEFRDRYLAFFDDLIVHGLPKDSGEAPRPSDKSGRFPRQERPPDPSSAGYAERFTADHRLLAEEVQRHKCTFTCFKGGRTSCRFLFPHDINPEPHYDADDNSINLRVTDPTLNWHNPTLLVATRHNQDLKAVQSGRSSVAAASYITSYATKSDETPANQISMINSVYERMANADMDHSDAHALLCRCVMQFGREQQLHAQQACTYVRDLGDIMQSHTTRPMLSGQLLRKIVELYGAHQDQEHEDANSPPTAHLPCAWPADARVLGDEHDGGAAQGTDEATLCNDGDEDGGNWLPLSTTGTAHQIDDYFHRGPTLSHLCFYDFVASVQLIKNPKNVNRNHHTLGSQHPNVKTHVHRHRPALQLGIPRAICQRFPRPDGTTLQGEAYCSAMLGHFRPFGVEHPLKTSKQSWQDAFAATAFSSAAKRIMENWNALLECDDARDAEQLSRRKREAIRSCRADDQASLIIGGQERGRHDADVEMEEVLHGKDKYSAESLNLISVLTESGWFETAKSNVAAFNATSAGPAFPTFSRAKKQAWSKELGLLQAKAKADQCVPKAAKGVLAEHLSFEDHVVPETTSSADLSEGPIRAHATKRMRWVDRPPHELLSALVAERNLTPSQALAFTIAGRQFFEEKHGLSPTPLRLLMHGEAGTGKTVVVRLLRELLDAYGRGGQILFVAPTGKAAAAVGGTTQHAAFGIEVQRRGLTADELLQTGTYSEARRIVHLEKTLGNIRWVFFDEVSMTSCEVMADIDRALRIGTQNREEPFGGVNVLFAGDLCQLPPVASSALYSSSSSATRTSEVRSKVELGRAAWLHVNEVVEFREQMRMQDADMAAALSRLRLRRCIQADAALFNANVLRSDANPSGIKIVGRSNLLVLARTNDAVRRLNQHQASVQAVKSNQNLAVSNASDKAEGGMTASLRESLLGYTNRGNVRAAIGRLPLFVGMPVIFKGGNQSAALGITNGTFGTIQSWDLGRDKFGLSVPNAAIVCFDSNATWCLSDLPPGCLPVYPTSTSFSFNVVGAPGTASKVTRRQLPLQPKFAMTIHSAQGITHTAGIVVDLRRGGFETYVAASRATSRSAIHLVHPVTVAQLNAPPLPSALRAELLRLQKLSEATKKAHDHDDWRLVDSTKRRRLN